METIEKKPPTQEQAEAPKLDAAAEAAIAQETVSLEKEIKEAEQQLGVPSEAAVDTVTELTALETAVPERQEAVKPAGPVISEQERMDSEMDVSQNGWEHYWIKRLRPEINILPDTIKNIVEKYNQKGKLSFQPGEEADYSNYIRERVTVKRFELSKREAMAKLKGELRDIDTGKFSPEHLKDRRAVYYNKKSESLFVKNEDGNEKQITFGDLVGDLAWGIRYAPDQSVPSLIRRKIAKTLALHETRGTVSSIYDKELSHRHNISSGTAAIPWGYIEKSVADDKKKFGKIGGGTAGMIAERAITEFLTRVQYNNAGLGIKIESANALEDTVLKYDFKIIAAKRRGIALEAEDTPREQIVNNKRNVGVQFTISSRPDVLIKKESQVEEARKRMHEYEDFVKRQVDDIALVAMPALAEFGGLYDRWLQEGKPSGGPEQYLSRGQKLEIFKQATAGLVNLSEQEIAELKI